MKNDSTFSILHGSDDVTILEVFAKEYKCYGSSWSCQNKEKSIMVWSAMSAQVEFSHSFYEDDLKVYRHV